MIISFSFSEKVPSSDSQIEGQAQLATANTAKIYKDLICPCCGKSIADCDCGMAAERRDFVDEQAAKGLDERGIFKQAIKKYGAEILFDQALAAEVKEELISEAPEDRPIISIAPESVDLGELSMVKGAVETIFRVKNVGKRELEISGMETSCMCTTALLRIDGQESPVFGMHDNPTDWSVTLEPGGEADLVVTFDPAFHGPEGTGAVMRTISIKSSDLIDSSKKVQFEAVVVE